jgi:CHAT domain-containing protein/Flp pilus assembly protein TadD
VVRTTEDGHISDEELELLVEDRVRGQAAVDSGRPGWIFVQTHLSSCKECQALVQQQVQGAAKLAELKMGEGTTPTSACPPGEDWREVAAGLLPQEQTEDRLQHAVECRHCAALLKTAAGVLTSGRTPEEEAVLAGLRSSSPSWQRKLARRLERSSKSPVVREQTGFLIELSTFRKLAAAFSLAAALGLVLVWTFKPDPAKVVSGLLVEAYSQQRTIETRIAGVSYAPVFRLRATESSRMERPRALLDAEARIAKGLPAKPDDPAWLHYRGLAELLENNADAAVMALEKAHRRAPEDSQIGTDLASAYFLRAETAKHPADYGQAAEILGQVLQKNPKDPVARFNRAIACERIFLYQQAEEDWRAYLQLDSSSSWANEARTRLADLQEKIRLQKERSEAPLLDPNAFLEALGPDNAAGLAAVSGRIEYYLDRSIEDWLPEALSRDRGGDPRSLSALAALQKLADLLASRHNDPWLEDLLRDFKAQPDTRSGLLLLASAIKANRTSDTDRARLLAQKSSDAFRAAGARAGDVRARFEMTFADQLGHRARFCVAEANRQVADARSSGYPWLRIQFLLESAACSDLSDESARRLTFEALRLAQQHQFKTLELRATTFLVASFQVVGDESLGWEYSFEGLQQYWKGDYPRMRGYSLYAGLDLLAEQRDQWHLDAQLIREAIGRIDNDPDLALRAFEQHRLALALLVTGNLSEAEDILRKSRALFGEAANGDRKTNLEAETEIALAGIELLRSQPREAITRLEAIRERIRAISNKDIALDFHRNLGLAYVDAGDWDKAEADLDAALALSEEALPLNRAERDRLIWSRRTDSAYRAMVRLKLRQDPAAAFEQWEWYKGASLRSAESTAPVGRSAARKEPAASLPYPLSDDTALISYTVFPDGLLVWVRTKRELRHVWMNVPAEEIALLARQFAERCSHRDSDLAALKRDGQLLYAKLFRPVETFVAGYRHLVIEPDESLWFAPFEALVDGNGNFLADRYHLSFSPGVRYLASASDWPGISAASRALVIGEPDVGSGWGALPEAAEEAKGIARRFRSNHLLVQDNPSLEEVRREIGEVDVFHFSGHTTVSATRVGLVLGDSTILDVSKLPGSGWRRTKLVVLSACSTANGTTGRFDDQDSLARLLAGGGVPEIVASRWLVDSRSTSLLMARFYSHLFSGESVSGSLRHAALDLRAEKEFAHPFYWAGFAAFGKS